MSNTYMGYTSKELVVTRVQEVTDGTATDSGADYTDSIKINRPDHNIRIY